MRQLIPSFSLSLLFLLLINTSISAGNRHVVRVLASNCKYNKNSPKTTNVLTGFVWQKAGKVKGVVTALHGVCGCSKISIEDVNGSNYFNVKIIQADITNDAALLSSSEIQQDFRTGLEFSTSSPSRFADENVKMDGYPLGISLQLDSKDMRIRGLATAKLKRYIKERLQGSMKKRGSPYPFIDVLNVEGEIVEGSSGSPLILNNTVIGIANGGLDDGINVCWAVPTYNIKFQSIYALGTAYKSLEFNNPNQLFPLSCALKGGSPKPDGGKLYLSDDLLTKLIGRFTFGTTSARDRSWKPSPACTVWATESVQCQKVSINRECTLLKVEFMCRKTNSRYTCGGGVSTPINENKKGTLTANLTYKEGVLKVTNPKVVIDHPTAQTDCDNEVLNLFQNQLSQIFMELD